MNFQMTTLQRNLVCSIAAISLCMIDSHVGAVIPISGRPVASMAVFDTTMTDFMTANSIEASVLGIMFSGQIVFLRGYGSQDGGVNMPENALVRLASCNKPITAAAIRDMDANSV